MQNHQLVNQSSHTVEFFTPPFILEAVRKVMGRIELDPASCEKANETVGAKRFFTAPEWEEIGHFKGVTDGGLSMMPLRMARNEGAFYADWSAETVWMNHPYGPPEYPCKPGCGKKICHSRGWHTASYVPGSADWVNLLCGAVRNGRVKTAMCITFASTSEGWFRPLLEYPQCYLWPRTNYLDASGKPLSSVTKGSVVTLLGEGSLAIFRDVFDGKLGTVKV